MSIPVAFFTDEVDPDLAVSLRKGREAGADAVEIRGRLLGKRVGEISDEDVAQMQRLLAREGLRVAVIGSPFGKCSHDDPAEIESHHALFRRMLELADAFQAPIIRGFAFWKPGGGHYDGVRPPLEEYLPVIVDFLAPAVAAAAAAGAVLCLETEDATMVGSCGEAVQVIEGLGGPAGIAVTWDVNNAWGVGEDPRTGYEQAADRILHLHVKPNAEKSIATVAGSDVPYRDVLEWLIADDYPGAASIEHWGSPEAMLSGIRQLRAVVDGLERSGR